MRSLLLIFIFSSSALASCPNLIGKYGNCQAQNATMDVPNKIEISQSLRNGVTNYAMTITEANGRDITTETIKADGKTYTQTSRDSDSGVVMSQETTASCIGQSLTLIVRISVENELFAHFKTAITKTGNELIQKSTGTSVGESFNDTVVCKLE